MITLEHAKKFIDKKVSLVYDRTNNLFTIKEVFQLLDMILIKAKENNFICNIEILKLEDGTRIDEYKFID